jgi:VCBS repeat-containing protein
MGAARNGLWGVFANPHGNTTGTLTAPQRDGFYVTRSEILYGAGGWIFSNTGGAQIAAELDATVPVDFPGRLLSSLHRFYGVIYTAGFSRLEFFETEGTVEDQKYIFGDDFTFAVFSASGTRRPFAADDLYSATPGSELLVGPPGVLNNDTDADGDPLTSVLVDWPQFGVLTLASDGSFVYYPDPGFAGDDSFTYVANDGLVNSNVGTVTIAVSGTNQPPIPEADAFTIEEGDTERPGAGRSGKRFRSGIRHLTAALLTSLLRL